MRTLNAGYIVTVATLGSARYLFSMLFNGLQGILFICLSVNDAMQINIIIGWYLQVSNRIKIKSSAVINPSWFVNFTLISGTWQSLLIYWFVDHSCFVEKYRMRAVQWENNFNTFLQTIVNISRCFGFSSNVRVCWWYLVVT